MDPLTHGLTGALIGKAFFAERHWPSGNRAGRVATISATLGAVFPDVDVVAGWTNDLAIIEVHRGVTHSLVCLPVFAALLAVLTRWILRRGAIPAPSWVALALIYGVGIASHILLDLITSFGTMVWSPLKQTRAAWDLTFIIDFVMTGILLLPQVLARVYRHRERLAVRVALAWGLFGGATLGCAWLAQAAGFPFSRPGVAGALLVLLAFFVLPAWRGWGFRLKESHWCRTGVLALGAYLVVCAYAHDIALERVRQFAVSRGLRVEHLGALPMPPSLAHWEGLIRAPDGVYAAQFDLLDGPVAQNPGNFRFVADTAPEGAVEVARQLPRVRTYLWFARFPVYRFAERADRGVLDISDLRFFRRAQKPTPFTFRVTFDSTGRVVEDGWVED